MDDERLVKPEYRILSGSMLKTIALISMLIDHTAYVLLPGSSVPLLTVGSHVLTLYSAMRAIGRLAFPIYSFLLVEGFFHTRDRKKYAMRLFLFALISEIPWNLEHSGTWRYAGQNVFFTLLLGFLGLCVIDRIENSEERRETHIFALLGLFILSILLKADYGCGGFGFILVMYLLRRRPVYRAVVGSCFLSSRWKAGLAFIPIALYNGERGFIRGKPLQILFYALYPLHMLLLYYIRIAMPR